MLINIIPNVETLTINSQGFLECESLITKANYNSLKSYFHHEILIVMGLDKYTVKYVQLLEDFEKHCSVKFTLKKK